MPNTIAPQAARRFIHSIDKGQRQTALQLGGGCGTIAPMFLDVVDLRDFYQGPTGLVVRRIINQRIHGFWPDMAGKAIAGIGYATPYLRPLRSGAARVLALMPAAQGVVRWPRDAASVSVLVDEIDLPLTQGALDAVLVVHALEAGHHPAAMLEEAWRVLKPGGKLLLIVPNRRGMWARVDRSPFGYGRPFSRTQLTALLREADFMPQRWAEALYVPPFQRRLLLRLAATFERIGTALHLPMAGILMVEAVKIAHGGEAVRVKPLARRVPVLAGRVAVNSRQTTIHR